MFVPAGCFPWRKVDFQHQFATLWNRETHTCQTYNRDLQYYIICAIVKCIYFLNLMAIAVELYYNCNEKYYNFALLRNSFEALMMFKCY
jgi:hypothetical protein